MGTPFENFVNTELPLRQVLLRGTLVPSANSGVPAVIGTYYLNLNTGKRYEKTGEADTAWADLNAQSQAMSYMTFTNTSGSIITAGTVLTVNSSGVYVPAKADTLANSMGTVGVVTETVAIGADGYIQTRDRSLVLTDANLTVGSRVYLSEINAGKATSTVPATAGNTILVLGIASAVDHLVLNIRLEVVILA